MVRFWNTGDVRTVGPYDHPQARDALVDAGRRLAERGLVTGTSGNVSVRDGDVVIVSPTGAALESLDAASLSVVDLDARHRSGPAPTSEVPLHLAVYRTTEARAIVHTHAVGSTAVSCLVEELPALHYQVMTLGGPPRTAVYATYGTEALAANVVAALAGGRCAALMANHGALAYGADLSQAIDRAELLEWLCHLHLAAHGAGRPRVLGAEALAQAADALAHYPGRLNRAR